MAEVKIAVIGATGNVGRLMVSLIPEYFKEGVELILAASENSVGRSIESPFGEMKVVSIEEALKRKPHIALFSAGANTSLSYAKKFTAKGAYVIDNSSAWRMHDEIPLIVPEINGGILTRDARLIANPNCSTIQLTMVLEVLEKNFDLERVVVSTYQSVSGAGKDALNQLKNERNGGHTGALPLRHPIEGNVIPHIDIFLENRYTKEEWKIMQETRKILALPQLKITATCVRVPVDTSHSESVNVELKKAFDTNEVVRLLEGAKGVTVKDKPKDGLYPMPLDSTGSDEVFVGRIRRDDTLPNGLNMWIVSDNLRKGAATNALQIARLVHEMKWVGAG